MYIYCLFVVFFFFFASQRCQNAQSSLFSLLCRSFTLLDFYLERKITEIRLWKVLNICFYLFCVSIQSLSECMRV